ncbi:hypothetical protein [Sphingomonas sp. Marseille-Q8236]
MSNAELVAAIAHILDPWAFETKSYNATIARDDATDKATQIVEALAALDSRAGDAGEVRDWRQSTMTCQTRNEAAQELSALANLIERPPLDDVQMSQDIARRMAGAIRIILADMNERDLNIKKAESGIADALLWLNVDYASGTGYVTRIWEARKALGKVSAALSHGEGPK